MSNLPLGEDLKTLFDEVTNGRGEGANTRAILVQLENGVLTLVDSVQAEGSDKDDFGPVLGKLFSASPTRSGYALYRLDSKSPAGLSEWLNCAYRPDGAKIREKMQYTLTHTSLMAGLSDQHFLETIYGGTAGDFVFPQKLRNARKHDYQNPQVSTKGKTAAEAAGGGIGESRRQFDARGAAASPAPVKTPLPSSEAADKLPASTGAAAVATPTPASDDRPDFPASMTEEGTQKQTTTVNEVAAPSDAPTSAARDGAGKTEEEERPDFPDSMTEMGTGNQSTTVDQVSTPTETVTDPIPLKDEPTTAQPLKSTDTALSTDKAVQEVEEASQKPGALSAIAQTASRREGSGTSTDSASGSIAPSAHANLGAAAVSGSVLSAEASNTKGETTADKAEAEIADRSASQSISAAPAVKSSIGTGRGAQGLETERERDLAQLKAQENAERSAGASGTGGPRTGLAWDGDVEPALRGLAKRGVTGATAEWNLVVLRLDLSKELVQLAVPPRMAMPGDVATALAEATQDSAQGGTQPCYAFYAHPQAQTDDSSSTQAALIYVCPMHSTVRQRMIYSSNVVSLVQHASSFDGLHIVKRLETSDAEELTPDFLVEAFTPADEASSASAGAAAFSRPKRPGRK